MKMPNLKRSGSITVYCLECNQSFKSPPSRLKKGRSRYCSKQCLSNALVKIYKGRKGLHRYGENNPNWKGIRKPKPCPVCGDIFIAATKTCSIECGHKLQGQKMAKDKNPMWTNQSNHLFRHYKELIQHHPQVCYICKQTSNKLLAHHIDGDRTHNTEANLTWLCLHCHTILHFWANNSKNISIQNLLLLVSKLSP